SLLARGVERDASLVAVDLEEERALATLRDRRRPAVLAAAPLLDANHVRAHVAEQAGAVGAGDVATEVEDANAFEDAAHARSVWWCRCGERRLRDGAPGAGLVQHAKVGSGARHREP